MSNGLEISRVYHVTMSGQLWEQLAGGSDPAFIGDFASRETASAEARRRAVAGRGDRIVIAEPGAANREVAVDHDEGEKTES